VRLRVVLPAMGAPTTSPPSAGVASAACVDWSLVSRQVTCYRAARKARPSRLCASPSPSPSRLKPGLHPLSATLPLPCGAAHMRRVLAECQRDDGPSPQHAARLGTPRIADCACCRVPMPLHARRQTEAEAMAGWIPQVPHLQQPRHGV
jgi:hypothetical protein